MKTREEIKKEFYERWDKTKEFGSGSTDNVYKDANKVWKWIEQELLSSPEKKEVCKEAFESGYGGKLSKKAEKEFENIYSKLEKKEENCAYIEFTDVDGSVYRTSAGNGLFDKDRVEKEEPTQELSDNKLFNQVIKEIELMNRFSKRTGLSGVEATKRLKNLLIEYRKAKII